MRARFVALSIATALGVRCFGASVQIGNDTGAVTALQVGTAKIPLVAGGGFILRDFSQPKPVTLKNGAAKADGDSQIFTAEGDDLLVTARFTPQNDHILVTGEIASTRPADRAIIVRYVLPLPAAGATFQENLSHSTQIASDTHEQGTIFPLAAMTGASWGAALEIPPTFPCCFALTGSADGLGVEFYLGVTPATKAFPNRAAYSFVIDAAQPIWGFRSALAHYYHRYPDCYQPRTKAAGFWNWNDPTGAIDPVHHPMSDEAMSLYSFHGLTHSVHGASGPYAEKVARDQRLGILSFAYTIVGMREITKLPDLPEDDDAAMTVFHDFAKKYQAGDASAAAEASADDRNRDLPDQIDNSTVFNADGHHRIRRRSTAWGANSVTFVENPNPHLYEDQHRATVGSVTLQLLENWMAHDPAPGIHLDSLGSQWPSCLNYRREHFAYAQYPLTFDQDGRIALHNRISHYEFIAAVDALARKHHKLVFGNGIDIYESRNLAEHYNGVWNGRFFMSAQLDVAGREIEEDVLTRDRLEAWRTCLGPKVMTAVLYRWQDPGPVKVDMNRALAYDIFAAPNRFFGDQISYLADPGGFARDRDFILWFIKHARLLHAAGWQPVTDAHFSDPAVGCERFGSGDAVYYTLINLGKATVEGELTIDMAALGLSPRNGVSSYYSEVARDAHLVTSTDGDTGHVRLALAPDETNIVKITRAW